MTTKAELIDGLADDSGQTKLATTAVLEALENMVADLLSQGTEVTIPGIVKISTKATEARVGRNPATGVPINIPAGRKIVFKALKSLKDAI